MGAVATTITVDDVKRTWDDYLGYLVATRYGVRDEKTGALRESTVEQVLVRVAGAWESRVRELVNSRGVKGALASALLKRDLVKPVVGAVLRRWIIPSTPVLSNLGSPARSKCYFACFPLGEVPDSMEGIMNTCSRMARIYKGGGGCGITVSSLRPKGALVDNGQGVASGPVSFMYLFGAVTGVIEQGGKRRGALMVQMDENHPDWRRFVCAKDNVSLDNPLNNMNISLNVWNFEEFVRSGKLREVAEHAWKSGDPGLFFMENQRRRTPVPLHLEPYYSNPCGEYLSIAETACNLITVNLAALASLTKDVRDFLLSVRGNAFFAALFANAIIFFDEGYPDDVIRKKTQQYRPVGVGFTGLHHVFMRFGVRYGSDESVELTRKIQAHLLLGTLEASELLAAATKRRTEVRPENYVPAGLEDYLLPECKQKAAEIRESVEKNKSSFNVVTTTQMPTGSTSLLGMVLASGVEPFFEVPTIRLTREIGEQGDSFREVELWPFEVFDDNGNLNEERLEKLREESALRLSVDDHLGIVSAVQEFCHTSVSKTINMPNNATVEDVEQVFKKAYELGLKAVTIYRDGSKQIQVLRSKEERNKTAGNARASNTAVYSGKKADGKVQEKKRSIVLPSIRESRTYALRSSTDLKLYVTVSRNGNSKPCEVFVIVGNSGTTLNGMAQALGKVISVALQENHDLADEFVRTLKGIDTGEAYYLDMPGRFTAFKSIPDAVAAVLEMELKRARQEHREESGSDEHGTDSAAEPFEMPEPSSDVGMADVCPQCGSFSLLRKGGCRECRVCGYSTC